MQNNKNLINFRSQKVIKQPLFHLERYNPEFQSTFSRIRKKISRQLSRHFLYVATLKTYFTTYPTTYFSIQKCIPPTTTCCGFAKQKCILARISRDKSEDILFSSIIPFFSVYGNGSSTFSLSKYQHRDYSV